MGRLAEGERYGPHANIRGHVRPNAAWGVCAHSPSDLPSLALGRGAGGGIAVVRVRGHRYDAVAPAARWLGGARGAYLFRR